MSLFSMIISLSATIFWILRVAISFMTRMEIDFLIKPLNANVELILCFVTFICIILIFKRKMWAAVIYLISYWGYFGTYIYNLIRNNEEIVSNNYINILMCLIGILLPFIILADIGLSQSSKKTSLKTKKTDWFYQNEQFDRKYDERADKNQYKF